MFFLFSYFYSLILKTPKLTLGRSASVLLLEYYFKIHWFWFVQCKEHPYKSAELRARASGARLTWLNYGRGWNKTPRPEHIPNLAPLRAPGQAGNVCTSPLLSLQSKSYLNQITKYPNAVLLMPPFVCSVFASFAFLHHFSWGLCPFFPAHLRCWFRSHTFDADSDGWRWKYFLHISRALTSFQALSHSLGLVLVTPLQIISAMTVLVCESMAPWYIRCPEVGSMTAALRPLHLHTQSLHYCPILSLPSRDGPWLGRFSADISEILENWK